MSRGKETLQENQQNKSTKFIGKQGERERQSPPTGFISKTGTEGFLGEFTPLITGEPIDTTPSLSLSELEIVRFIPNEITSDKKPETADTKQRCCRQRSEQTGTCCRDRPKNTTTECVTNRGCHPPTARPCPPKK